MMEEGKKKSKKNSQLEMGKKKKTIIKESLHV